MKAESPSTPSAGQSGPLVGVLVNVVGGYSRAVIRGVGSFAIARGWRCRVEGVNAPALARSIHGFDGLIVQTSGDQLRDLAVHSPCPVVNVSSAMSEYATPSVVTDDRAVGRLGGDHLLRLGYRDLLFFSPDERQFAKLRHEGFLERCRTASAKVRYLGSARELKTALGDRQGPLALMGCNDRAALAASDLARDLGLRVPEDLAVLGVDNDDLVQSVAAPPLSTINTARERIGFEAAQLLERLLQGQEVVERVILVPPRDVIVRRSTDASAVADERVREALRFISTAATRRIGVVDVADHVAISRRQLERRFSEVVGRSVHEEIRRRQIERARQLLRETDLTLPQVADASGFGSASYFNVAFSAETGQTPGAFREQASRGFR